MTGYKLLSETREEMLKVGMWTSDCPVTLERLSSVLIRYVDFSGQHHDDGEIVVFDVVAESVKAIFDVLFQLQFPIARVRSVHAYSGDDELSMADNNSSCFNCRPIEGTTITSIHSYGLAIDLNPEQNPYVIFDEQAGTAKIYPPQAWSYLNRSNRKPGMVEDVVEIFSKHGFGIWGGRWTTPIDLHHFQASRGIAELLARTSYEDGKTIWNMSRQMPANVNGLPHGADLQPLLEAYDGQDHTAFFDGIERILRP